MEMDETKQVKLKDKPLLTINEASEYFGLGIHKLYALSESPDCNFVLWVGSKRLLKKRKAIRIFDASVFHMMTCTQLRKEGYHAKERKKECSL